MANLVFKKKYSNTYEYLQDMAKTSEYYDPTLGNNAEVGASYIRWLGSKRAMGEDLSAIKSANLTDLDAGNAFTYLQYKTGDIKEEDLVKGYGLSSEEFKNTYGSVEGFFDKAREDNYGLRMFNYIDNFTKFWNGTGYVLSGVGTGVLSFFEGLIDAGIGLYRAGADIFTNDQEYLQSIENALTHDTLGASAAREWREEFGRYKVYGDAGKFNFTRMVGDAVESLTKVTSLMIPVVGPYLYYASSSGNILEQSVKENPGKFWQSFATTAVQTAVEATIEKLNPTSILNIKGFGIQATGKLGKVLNVVKSKGVGKWALGALGEGVEEVVTELVNAPLDALIMGNKLDSKEMFENALYAGIVGLMSGMVMEGANIAATNKNLYSSIGKFNKAQTLLIGEMLSNNEKTLQNIQNLEVDKLVQETGKTKEQLETSKDANEQSRFKAAIEQDAKTMERAETLAQAFAGMIDVIGADRFNEAFKIADDTAKARMSVVRRLAEVANRDGLTIDAANKQEKLDAYNKSHAGIGFIPVGNLNNIDEKYEDSGVEITTRQRAEKMAKLFKKKYGKTVVFGTFVKLKTGIASNSSEKGAMFDTLDDGTIIASIDQFQQMSPVDFVVGLMSDEVVNKAIANEKTKGILNVIRRNKIYEGYTDKQLLTMALFDPKVLRNVYGLDKATAINLINEWEASLGHKAVKDFKDAKREIFRTSVNQKKTILQTAYDGTYSKKLLEKSNKKLVDFLFSKIKVVPEDQRPEGWWAYVDADYITGGNLNKDSVVSQDIFTILQEFGAFVSDEIPDDLLNIKNYSEKFKTLLLNNYGKVSPDTIQSFFYDTQGVVWVPQLGTFMVPIDFSKFINQDNVMNVKTGDTLADILDEEKFKAEYPSVNLARNVFGLDDLKDVSFEIFSDPNDPTTGELLEGENGLKIRLNSHYVNEFLETIIHEMLHLSFENNGLPVGAPDLTLVENALVAKYGPVDTWLTGEHSVELAELYTLAYTKRKTIPTDSAEFAKDIVKIFYNNNIGERAVEYKDSVKKKIFNAELLKNKNYFETQLTYDNKTGKPMIVLQGFGKFKKFSMEFEDTSIETKVLRIEGSKAIIDLTDPTAPISSEAKEKLEKAIKNGHTNRKGLIKPIKTVLQELGDINEKLLKELRASKVTDVEIIMPDNKKEVVTIEELNLALQEKKEAAAKRQEDLADEWLKQYKVEASKSAKEETVSEESKKRPRRNNLKL